MLAIEAVSGWRVTSEEAESNLAIVMQLSHNIKPNNSAIQSVTVRCGDLFAAASVTHSAWPLVRFVDQADDESQSVSNCFLLSFV